MMMLRNLCWALRSITLAGVLCAGWVGEAHGFSFEPPSGRTGAPPGSTTCATCHGGAGSGSLNVAFTGNTSYTPGEVYSLLVTVSDPGKKRFGFSMVARDTSDNTTDVGTWSITDAVTTQAYGLGNAHVGHRDAPFVDDQFTFSVDWTAPASGVGDITFYVVGNGANGMLDTAGDNIYATTVTVSEFVAPPPAPTELSDLVFFPDGSTQFTLSGSVGRSYLLEFSEDMINWNPLGQRTLEVASEVVNDPAAAGKSRRMYRATRTGID